MHRWPRPALVIAICTGALVVPSASTLAKGKSHQQAVTCTLSIAKDGSQFAQKLDAKIDQDVNPALTAINMLPLHAGANTWQFTQNGTTAKLTVSVITAGSSYTFEADAAPAGTTSFTKVASGSLNTSSGATQGTATIDFDALHSVDSASTATGQVTASFSYLTDASKPSPGEKRSYSATFTNLKLSANDTTGPRTGSYRAVVEPGIGGVYQVQATHPMSCKGSNAHPVGTVQTVNRWYTDNSQTYSRVDNRSTSGFVPTGQTFAGVSCGLNSKTSYSLTKLENSSGSTVSGSARQTGTSSSCGSAFGAVPSPTSNATDYSFPGTATFPNEW